MIFILYYTFIHIITVGRIEKVAKKYSQAFIPTNRIGSVHVGKTGEKFKIRTRIHARGIEKFFFSTWSN